MIYVFLLGIIVFQILRIQDLKDEIGYLKRRQLRRRAELLEKM